MTGLILFAFIALCMLYGILKLTFFKLPGVSTKVIAAIFVLKIFLLQVQVHLAKKHEVNADIYHVFEGTAPFAKLFTTDAATAMKIFFGAANELEVKPITRNFPGWNHRLQSHNDTRTLVRLNMLTIPLHWYYFSVMNLLWCFFSLSASVWLCRNVLSIPLFSKIQSCILSRILLVCFTMLPGSLFWFSMAYKETVAWCFFILFAGSLIRAFTRPRILTITWLVFSFLIFISIKLYFAIAVMAALLFYAALYYFRKYNVFSISSIILFSIVISWIVSELLFKNNLVSITIYRQASNTINYASKVDASTLMPALLSEPTVFNILQAIPEAIIRILFNPIFPEVSNYKLWFPSIENIIFLLLIVVCLFNFKYRKELMAVSISMLFFALSSIALIGLTTPIIGTYIRYKVLFVPFIIFAFAMHFNFERIKFFEKWNRA